MYNSKFLNINSPTNLPLGADLVWGQWGYVPPPKFRNLFWLILKSQNLKKKLNQSPFCCLLKILWTALKFYKLLGTFKKKKKNAQYLDMHWSRLLNTWGLLKNQKNSTTCILHDYSTSHFFGSLDEHPNWWLSSLSMDLKSNYVVTHKIGYFHMFISHNYLLP
jgi:hypothetical protein